MNFKLLDTKRLYPCFEEVYAKSQKVVDVPFPITWENMMEMCVCGFEGIQGNELRRMMPYDMFFLDFEELKQIVEKWCKGLHTYWYYLPKLNPEDPKYQEKIKELEDFRKFEEEVSKDKSLTSQQRRIKIEKEALQHNFRKRSRGREYISNTIMLGPSPTCNFEAFERAQQVYKIVSKMLDDMQEIPFKRWSRSSEEPSFELMKQEAESYKSLCNSILDSFNEDIKNKQELVPQAIALYLLVHQDIGM